MATWRNWSGSVETHPAEIFEPETEAALQAKVAAAAKVRVIGAGHSFMPLGETDGVLVRLDRLAGAIEVLPGNRVWAPAGWSLARLTAALWPLGYSLPNQGDVDPQSLAGAIGTGTHGTGAGFGSLSTLARAFRLVLADGSVVECSPDVDPDLFQAARLSLGLVGIATRILIDVLPAFHLDERETVMPLDEAAERWDDLVATHRHVEFFLFPYADKVILKTLDQVEPSDTPLKPQGSERGFQMYCDAAAALPGTTETLQRGLMTAIKGGGRRVGPAHRVFPSERNVRFEEMEYELPRAEGFPALRAAVRYIRERQLPIVFPFEFRVTAGDDIWLSPFNRGPCASVSMHQYAKLPWQAHFAEAEAIFRGFGGRPHWGKRHTLAHSDVRALYPMADRFAAVCARVDPAAKFANAFLAGLFGLAGQTSEARPVRPYAPA